jgi:hypothetical protein
MKRRAFLAGAAALVASPALPVSPVGAGEWWTPEVLSKAGAMFATNAECLVGTSPVYFLHPTGFYMTQMFQTELDKLTENTT